MRAVKRLAARVLGVALPAAGSAKAEEMSPIFATGHQSNNAIDAGFLRPRAARVNEAGKGILHLEVGEGMSVNRDRVRS